MHIFLAGVGTVGGKLIEKLMAQAEKLMTNDRLLIRIAGVANSKRMALNPQGLNPANIKDLLSEGQPSTPELFANAIKNLNLSNSVFVDCTASYDIAALYDTMLENNINVVTANKIASSSDSNFLITLSHILSNSTPSRIFLADTLPTPLAPL